MILLNGIKKMQKNFCNRTDGINVLNLRELEELETIIDFYIK